MEAILFLLVIVLFVQYNSLSKRFRAIETKLGIETTPTRTSAPAARSTAAVTSEKSAPVPTPAPTIPTTSSEPLFIERAVEWLKRDTLLKTGAFFLLLGFFKLFLVWLNELVPI